MINIEIQLAQMTDNAPDINSITMEWSDWKCTNADEKYKRWTRLRLLRKSLHSIWCEWAIAVNDSGHSSLSLFELNLTSYQPGISTHMRLCLDTYCIYNDRAYRTICPRCNTALYGSTHPYVTFMNTSISAEWKRSISTEMKEELMMTTYHPDRKGLCGWILSVDEYQDFSDYS